MKWLIVAGRWGYVFLEVSQESTQSSWNCKQCVTVTLTAVSRANLVVFNLEVDKKVARDIGRFGPKAHCLWCKCTNTQQRLNAMVTALLDLLGLKKGNPGQKHLSVMILLLYTNYLGVLPALSKYLSLFSTSNLHLVVMTIMMYLDISPRNFCMDIWLLHRYLLLVGTLV